MTYSILVAIDVLLAVGIIGLILIQQGKGADVGAAFGSGASGTVFGARGSASFLTRITAVLAALFFINSLALAYLASNRPVEESVIDSIEEVESISSVKSSAEEDNRSDLSSQEGKISDLPDAELDQTDEVNLNESQSDNSFSETDESTPDDIPE